MKPIEGKDKLFMGLKDKEKGVDAARAVKLIKVSEIWDIIYLISLDKDYIPVLEYLIRKGKYMIHQHLAPIIT